MKRRTFLGVLAGLVPFSLLSRNSRANDPPGNDFSGIADGLIEGEPPTPAALEQLLGGVPDEKYTCTITFSQGDVIKFKPNNWKITDCVARKGDHT